MEAAQEIKPVSASASVNRQAGELERQLIFFSIALAVLFAVCWKCYGQCCNIGFTLDEFSHVPYVYQAFHGHPEDFLAKFYSTFSDPKIVGLASYRPLTALSFAGDYAIWRANAFGWHFDTLLSFFAMCVVSGLLVFEMLKRVWSTPYAAFAGGLTSLLMIIYPGHPDSAVTIVGRHDCLATAFLYGSMYLYALARTGKRTPFFTTLSLISFFLGLSSKEIAVTLPVILCLGELLNVFSAAEQKESLLTRLKRTAPFWALLAVFGIARTIFLHALIGGYGAAKHGGIFRQLLVFADQSTLKKLFLPINEHFPLPEMFMTALACLYAYPLIRLFFRCSKDSRLARLSIFFAIFAVLNVLPSFQIWHIFPNMVGARLFIVSSISIACLSAIALTPNSKYFVLNCADIAWAAALVLAWNIALTNNLIAFETSGVLMQALRGQVVSLINTTPKGRYLIVTGLPMDYCGAPMLGKANFLKINLQPPFTQSDLYSKVVVIENGQLVYLSEKPDMTIDLATCPVYSWSNESGRFARIEAH